VLDLAESAECHHDNGDREQDREGEVLMDFSEKPAPRAACGIKAGNRSLPAKPQISTSKLRSRPAKILQVLRKTNASLSKKAGVDPKVSADQRGHGLGVSMGVYTISDRQQKKQAVDRLEAAVLRKRKQKLSA
jgi:hypothetical protein